VRLARTIDVVGVVAAPGQKPEIFLAPDGGADPFRSHIILPETACRL
jgi:hypothetical protein